MTKKNEVKIPVATATATKLGGGALPTLVLPSSPVMSQAMDREGASPSTPPARYDSERHLEKEPFTVKFTKPSLASVAGVSFRHNRQGYVIVARIVPDGLVAEQTDLATDMKITKINGEKVPRHMPIGEVRSMIQSAQGEVSVEAKPTDKSIASERFLERMSQRMGLDKGVGLVTVTIDKPSPKDDLGLTLESDGEGLLVIGSIAKGGLAAQKQELIEGMRVQAIEGFVLSKDTPVEDAMGMLSGKERVTITVTDSNLLEPVLVARSETPTRSGSGRRNNRDDCCDCYCDCGNCYCYDSNGQAACCDTCCHCFYFCSRDGTWCHNCCESGCSAIGNGCENMCTPCGEACDGCDSCCQSGCSALVGGCEGCCTGNECDGCCQSGCEAFTSCDVGLEPCCHCFYGCLQCCLGCLCECPAA